MNKLTFIFCLLSFFAITSCSSNSGDTAANTETNSMVEVAKIDSVTTLLQQAEQEIKTTEKALDEALNELDF